MARKQLKQKLCEQCNKQFSNEPCEPSECLLLLAIENAVEVAPGRWENITGGMVMLGDCSECKVRQPVIGTNYCKNCGAKMNGGRCNET